MSKEKAIWDAEATAVFCKLCALEKEKGNRPLKFLSPVGYMHLAAGFLSETGRDYTKQQFKNKWDSMKKEYTNWHIFKNKTTGLGWNNEANTVVADDGWWKKMGEENKELLAFRKHGPEHLDEMSRMFENVLVTGESSVMPGTVSGSVLPEGANVHNNEDEDESEVQITPGPAKRGAGQLENPKRKNPVQRDFKRMVDHMISEDAAVADSKNTIVTDIETIMEEVVKCGAQSMAANGFMELALDQAKFALDNLEVPVGCVIVENGKVISSGSNRTNATRNATRHAEMEAIDFLLREWQSAGLDQPLVAEKFAGCDLYVTCEPCIMCASALSILGIREVYFGCANDKFGGCGSVMSLHERSSSDDLTGRQDTGPRGFKCTGGLMAEEAVALFRNFYEQGNPNAPKPHRPVRVDQQ